MHDIGKSLVASMPEGDGFQVTSLGADVSPQGAKPVCLSAPLTVTMPSMKTTIQALQEAGNAQRQRDRHAGAAFDGNGNWFLTAANDNQPGRPGIPKGP